VPLRRIRHGWGDFAHALLNRVGHRLADYLAHAPAPPARIDAIRCRYITRPAIANERLGCNGKGEVVLQLKSPWRDGTTP
jgi:hypothetical protein